MQFDFTLFKLNIKAKVKLLMSYRKTSWELADYPILYKYQDESDENSPKWVAQIINWWLVIGSGDTKAEAYESLEKCFNERKESGSRMPRPGVLVPMEFAPVEKLDKYWEVASKIILEVCRYDPNGIIVTDGSQLSDFPGDLHEYYEKIIKIFGVDVSHIKDSNIADISEYISNKKLKN